MFHTLGQRQGLGIGGVKGYPEEPWYVLHKDLDENVLFVGQGHDHPWLFADSLKASQLTWITGQAPGVGTQLTAKIRYRQADQGCTVAALDGDSMAIVFDEPQRAITPGQSVVLYSGDECLGGGIIESMNTPPMNKGAAA